jgi:SAM-dependent methyltransferase
LDRKKTEVRHCKECDFVFFQRRLTDSEVRKLYTNYRGDDYNKVRISVEPSYAPLVAYFADPLSPYYVDRLRDYYDLLEVFPELARPKSVLDFGGDGSVPKRLFGGAKIVIDDLSAGSSEIASSQYDVVFASNVLEHVSDPVAALKEVARKISPEGVLLIDVPKPKQASLGEGLRWQERHHGELFEMHEHINHFSRRSLGLLVAAAGLESFFEFAARHGAQTALAAFPGSSIARRMSAERAARTLLFETRMARAETQAANFHLQNLSRIVAEQSVAGLRDEVQKLRHQVESLGELALQGRNDEVRQLRQQVQSLFDSTSWRISAPIRSVKNTLRKTKQLLGFK